MTVSEIANKTCLTRQWLNKLADRGEIPGATRKANGRLRIEDCPKLRSWVRRTANSVLSYRAARGRIHERRLAKAAKELDRITTKMTRHRNLDKQLQKVRALRKEVSEAEKASARDYYTCGEIARYTGYHRRHIARLAQDIPGAMFVGTKWNFQKSEEANIWIRDAKNKRAAAIQEARADRSKSKRATGAKTINWALYQLIACIQEVTATRPIEEWTLIEINAFLDDAEPIAEAYMAAQNRWKALNP